MKRGQLLRRLSARQPVIMLLALTMFVPACGDADPGHSVESGAATSNGCSGIDPLPVTREALLASLNRNGFASRQGGPCASADVAVVVTNEGSGVEDDRGYLLCNVYDRPLLAGGFDFPTATVREATEERARVAVANVECFLYARGDPPAYALAQLRAALNAVA